MVSTSPSLNHDECPLAPTEPKNGSAQGIVAIEHQAVDRKQTIAALEPGQARWGLLPHTADLEANLSVGFEADSHLSAGKFGDDVFGDFLRDDFGC